MQQQNPEANGGNQEFLGDIGPWLTEGELEIGKIPELESWRTNFHTRVGNVVAGAENVDTHLFPWTEQKALHLPFRAVDKVIYMGKQAAVAAPVALAAGTVKTAQEAVTGTYSTGAEFVGGAAEMGLGIGRIAKSATIDPLRELFQWRNPLRSISEAAKATGRGLWGGTKTLLTGSKRATLGTSWRLLQAGGRTIKAAGGAIGDTFRNGIKAVEPIWNGFLKLVTFGKWGVKKVAGEVKKEVAKKHQLEMVAKRAEAAAKATAKASGGAAGAAAGGGHHP